MTVSDSVAGHYGRPGLEHEILAALETSQVAVDVDGLAPIDEFHSGGRQATAALTAQLDLQPGSHVLDVGSGIGGTAVHRLDLRVPGYRHRPHRGVRRNGQSAHRPGRPRRPRHLPSGQRSEVAIPGRRLRRGGSGYLPTLPGTRAGLKVTSVRDWTASVLEFVRRAQAAPPGQGRLSPGPHLLMGEDFAAKTANVISAMQRGVVAPMEIIATRPSS